MLEKIAKTPGAAFQAYATRVRSPKYLTGSLRVIRKII